MRPMIAEAGRKTVVDRLDPEWAFRTAHPRRHAAG